MRVVCLLFAALFFTSCSEAAVAPSAEVSGPSVGSEPSAKQPPPEQPEKLLARPRKTADGEPVYGRSRLNLSPGRDGFLFVPQSYRPGVPTPLALMLHGANGDASNGIGPYSRSAEERGIILLAPASRDSSWDLMRGGYGPDIEFIDRALEKVFARYAIDPRHIAIQGFSDGASYALSVGLANPELFSHVVAFSPGYVDQPSDPPARPKVWVSHGTEDDILPIESTSRQIVPDLKDRGYDVHYEEFDGPHRPWPDMSEASLDWWLKDR